MKLQVNNTLKDRGLLVGVCLANGIVVRPSSSNLTAQLDALVAKRKDQEYPPPNVKEAVRNLLKTGGFKPSGRNKPASEYLAQAAREGRFPSINNLVDVNNLVSLTTGLPISLLDAEELKGGVLMRHGRGGERYVFNAAGQDIDLSGLICTCSEEEDKPLGNPVKDSVTGKIKDSTRSVIGIIYAPASGELADAAKSGLETFARLLAEEGQAQSVETRLE